MAFQEESGVFPAGPYTAWVDDDTLVAEVRKPSGAVAKRFRGESAWSEAVRIAGDMNQKHEMDQRR